MNDFARTGAQRYRGRARIACTERKIRAKQEPMHDVYPVSTGVVNRPHSVWLNSHSVKCLTAFRSRSGRCAEPAHRRQCTDTRSTNRAHRAAPQVHRRHRRQAYRARCRARWRCPRRRTGYSRRHRRRRIRSFPSGQASSRLHRERDIRAVGTEQHRDTERDSREREKNVSHHAVTFCTPRATDTPRQSTAPRATKSGNLATTGPLSPYARTSGRSISETKPRAL